MSLHVGIMRLCWCGNLCYSSGAALPWPVTPQTQGKAQTTAVFGCNAHVRVAAASITPNILQILAPDPHAVAPAYHI